MDNMTIYALTKSAGGGVTKAEVQRMIDTSIADIDALSRQVVASVSDIDVTAPDADKYIYMVAKTDGQSGDNYNEYMVIDGKIEHIGDTTIDLSDYVKNTQYASGSVGGVIRLSANHGLGISTDGYLMATSRTAEQVSTSSGNMLIGVSTARNCAEEWTFTLADGTTVTKNVFVVPPKV